MTILRRTEMITEEYLKENFITAHFIDNERKNIEILSTSEDKTQTIPTIIEYNEEHPSFKALMTMITLDQLHEYTYQKVKNERKNDRKNNMLIFSGVFTIVLVFVFF